MPFPYAALDSTCRADSASPRLTWYDRSGGPTHGERVELSGRLLLMWANKAANLLLEEHDVGPGTRVALALPVHWRACYWALACWALGATVSADPDAADVVVTDDSRLADRAPERSILITLPALARRAPQEPPASAIDEAATISGYPDDLSMPVDPSPEDVALDFPERHTTYREMSAEATRDGDPTGERLLLDGDLDAVLHDAARTWARGGSVLLIAGASTEERATVMASERASVRRGGPTPSR
ncbi:MAG TPA: TIGR03089 family protein [Dermatophilaceae bacterium]|jgi:uncharacterized protein (TIGR03089 family)|nr:TIGR03089 family protein [Dermatophilaceae bacterium]